MTLSATRRRMETSTTETADTQTGIAEGAVGRRLFVLVRFVVYGLAATFGSLAVLSGLGTYLDHAGDGIDPSLLSVVAVIAVGWTLLLIALSGAVACGIGRGAP